MPGIFGAINTRVQGKLAGQNLKSLAADLPDIKIINQEGWVESITVPGTQLFIKGKYDLLAENDDGTHTLIDLKLSTPDVGKIEKYQSQLWGYKFALEHPKNGPKYTISQMGLLIFYPDRVAFHKNEAMLTFPPKWLEVKADDKQFLSFMKSINDLLTEPLPAESPACKWCQYRHLGELRTHTNQEDPNLAPF